MRRIIAVLSLIVAAALGCEAATKAYFVNIYPGPDIYELEGHSALVIDDGATATAYNFGVFDFNAPNFVYRFVKGETDYMAAACPWPWFAGEYAQQGRRVVAHELNLTDAQTERLSHYLADVVLPENRTYRYNYVLDNCATRPLRAVELAAADTILSGPAPFEANSSIPMTFRNIMRSYHRNYPWYQFGIDLALGSGIDYPISSRQATFAPAELDRMIDNMTVGGKPLVSRTLVVNDVAPDAAIMAPTPWYLTPLTAAMAIFVLAAALTVRDIRRHRTTRWFDAVFFGILGFLGLLLTFLIFISEHEATSPNYLYAWLNPLCLIPTIFIWIKCCKNVVVWYQIINFVVLLVLVASWWWLPQSANAAFWPLIGAEMLRAASYVYINRPRK